MFYSSPTGAKTHRKLISSDMKKAIEAGKQFQAEEITLKIFHCQSFQIQLRRFHYLDRKQRRFEDHDPGGEDSVVLKAKPFQPLSIYLYSILLALSRRGVRLMEGATIRGRRGLIVKI